MENSRQSEQKRKYEKFVEYIFQKRQIDTGFKSRMRNSMNPLKETSAWGDISFYCDLTNENDRKIYLLIGSAIADDKAVENGANTLGRAIAQAWRGDDGKIVQDEKGPSAMRIRRLLACRTVDQLCSTLRPLLRLIRSREVPTLDYALLLKELISFKFNAEPVKARWAKSFYGFGDDGIEELEQK